MNRRPFAVLLLIASLSLTLPAAAAPPARDRPVTLMTWNVYHGVDAQLEGVAAALASLDPANPSPLFLAMAALFAGYETSDFPKRAAAIADRIAETKPYLIGLQEAILVRTGPLNPAPFTPTASQVEHDYVATLLAALAARGLKYEVVVEAPNFDAELPSPLDGRNVRHTDREVILARSDVKTSELKLSNELIGGFTANCVPVPGIVLRRGWVSVDAKIRGKSFRLISTHLDASCPTDTSPENSVQAAQAYELLHGPAVTNLPVVLIGDFNSAADSGVTYQLIRGAWFDDAALDAGASRPTCCNAANLANVIPLLETTSRIDFVFHRGGFTVGDADVVGDSAADLLPEPAPRWPSDHAGVTATLVLPHP